MDDTKDESKIVKMRYKGKTRIKLTGHILVKDKEGNLVGTLKGNVRTDIVDNDEDWGTLNIVRLKNGKFVRIQIPKDSYPWARLINEKEAAKFLLDYDRVDLIDKYFPDGLPIEVDLPELEVDEE